MNQQSGRTGRWSGRPPAWAPTAALLAAVGASFGLFWALTAGSDYLAAAAFAVVALSMAATMWSG